MKMKHLLLCLPILTLPALSGCSKAGPTAREIVPKIEGYKATVKTIEACAAQISGAVDLISAAENIYTSKTFKKYVDSAMREVKRAENNCEKYLKAKEDGSKTEDALISIKESISESVRSALTVVENGINQEEAYKAIPH